MFYGRQESDARQRSGNASALEADPACLPPPPMKCKPGKRIEQRALVFLWRSRMPRFQVPSSEGGEDARAAPPPTSRLTKGSALRPAKRPDIQGISEPEIILLQPSA